MLEIVSDPASGKTINVVLSSHRMLDSEHEEVHFFRLSPKGALELAVFGESFFKNGEVVKGAGKAARVDLNAPGVQDEFKSELDFWLSGKYRQQSAPKPANPHQAPGSKP